MVTWKFDDAHHFESFPHTGNVRAKSRNHENPAERKATM